MKQKIQKRYNSKHLWISEKRKKKNKKKLCIKRSKQNISKERIEKAKQANKNKVVRLFRIVFLSAELAKQANPSRRSARAWWHVATRGQTETSRPAKVGLSFSTHTQRKFFGKNALFWKLESSKFEGAGFCEFN